MGIQSKRRDCCRSVPKPPFLGHCNLMVSLLLLSYFSTDTIRKRPIHNLRSRLSTQKPAVCNLDHSLCSAAVSKLRAGTLEKTLVLLAHEVAAANSRESSSNRSIAGVLGAHELPWQQPRSEPILPEKVDQSWTIPWKVGAGREHCLQALDEPQHRRV